MRSAREQVLYGQENKFSVAWRTSSPRVREQVLRRVENKFSQGRRSSSHRGGDQVTGLAAVRTYLKRSYASKEVDEYILFPVSSYNNLINGET